MARDRTGLHNQLVDILGSSRVYFQAPSNIRNYPTIIYKLDDTYEAKADNKRYLNMRRYLVTLIDHDPDTELLDELLELPHSSFENHFVVDNLNHYICNIYY